MFRAVRRPSPRAPQHLPVASRDRRYPLVVALAGLGVNAGDDQ
jgi:hypothetical protein